MTPELTAQLVVAVITLLGVIRGILEQRQTAKKVDDNTEITQQAARRVDLSTVDRLRLDELEQWYAVYTASDECEPCRAKMEAFKDRRRRIAPLGTPHDQP